jgi:hypothetical protein
MEQLVLPAQPFLHTVSSVLTELAVAPAPRDTRVPIAKLAFQAITSIAVLAPSAHPSVLTAWSALAPAPAHPVQQDPVDPLVSTASQDTIVTLMPMEPVLPAMGSAPCVMIAAMVPPVQCAQRATREPLATHAWLGTTTTQAHASSAQPSVLNATSAHPILPACFAPLATQALTAARASLATITAATSALLAPLPFPGVNIAPLELPALSALLAIPDLLVSTAL